ncbi:MAG TPA: phasin family protein [Alphaproteobacteria bacterium]|nr:phasin family protein [Alphaproteobacteria bacterium]
MAKQHAPFWDADVTKMMGEFKFPGVDMDVILSAQRRNVEALTQANQLALEGVQAVVRRQMDVMRQSLEEMSTMATELMNAGTPEARIAKQAEMTKASFEKTVANLKELSEMVGKSNGEAIEVINRRISAMLDEMKTAAKK